MMSPEAIQRDVLAELAWDPSVEAGSIGVSVKDAVVTLSGHVGTYLEKQAAEDAVKRVAGVKAIANQLEVRLHPHLIDDTDIAEAAVRALEWNLSVPEERIRITVEHGQVTLEGVVDWQYQKEAAERALRILDGVRSVENRIKITPRPAPADAQRQIEDALRRSATLEAQRIKVEVCDSRVILRGTVRSFEERDAAEQAAWAAPGVTAVDNFLDVENELSAAGAHA